MRGADKLRHGCSFSLATELASIGFFSISFVCRFDGYISVIPGMCSADKHRDAFCSGCPTVRAGICFYSIFIIGCFFCHLPAVPCVIRAGKLRDRFCFGMLCNDSIVYFINDRL